MWPSSDSARSTSEAQKLGVLDIAGDGHALGGRPPDPVGGVGRIGLLDAAQVRDEHVGALTREGDGDCLADPRVAAGDERDAVGQAP